MLFSEVVIEATQGSEERTGVALRVAFVDLATQNAAGPTNVFLLEGNTNASIVKMVDGKMRIRKLKSLWRTLWMSSQMKSWKGESRNM